MQVGNGRNIDTLNDNWLGRKCIHEMDTDTMVEIIPPDTMVRDPHDIKRDWSSEACSNFEFGYTSTNVCLLICLEMI